MVKINGTMIINNKNSTSIIISDECAVLIKWIMPKTHNIDKNMGKTYFMQLTQVLPTLIFEYLFNVGNNFSRSNSHANITVWMITVSIITKSLRKPSTTPST